MKFSSLRPPGRCLHLPVLASLLVACPPPEEGELASDYQLTLDALTLEGQDPFADEPDMSLVLQYPDGSREILPLGQAGQGNLELGELPPLEAGVKVGLLAEEPGGDASAWDPELTVAYGQTIVPEDLGAGGEQVELQILMPLFEQLGAWGKLGAKKAAVGGAVAMSTSGDVFLFGGVDEDGARTGADPALDRIARLPSESVTGDFEELDVGFPEADAPLFQGGTTTITGRLFHTVTPVVGSDGEELMLVVGGRQDYTGPDRNTAQAFLFDPNAEEVVWTGEMEEARSEHTAVLMHNGHVLVLGGLYDQGVLYDTLAYEVFNPKKKKFTRGIADLEMGPYMFAAASLGTEGALICGGYHLDLSDNEWPFAWTSDTTCQRITLEENVVAAAELPRATGAHAMAQLDDGRVLLSGGVNADIPGEFPQIGDAVPHAYIYDAGTDSWTEVGPLNEARAHHMMIPMPTGRIMVIGGVKVGGTIDSDMEDPVLCIEVFDPTTETFSLVTNSCVNAGSGAQPQVAQSPGNGVFVLEGRTQTNLRGAGARHQGLIGYGPPF